MLRITLKRNSNEFPQETYAILGETFSPNKDYTFADNYKASGLELVLPIEEGKDKLSLQHLLIVNDTVIVKHWRQDWVYENTNFHLYNKDNSWKYVSKTPEQVKGQWTQKVYQVDDGPRYEGSATWVHVDGRHYWESTADSPLPRREFTKRKDYNVMIRGNRHEITSYGWLHEQDNDKVLRDINNDVLIAQEKGLNTYKKTNISQCAVAEKWWNDHKIFWADVRNVWSELVLSKTDLSIRPQVDDKVLFMRLFEIEKEMLSKQPYDSNKSQQTVKEVIQAYLVGDFKFASAK